jgi:hypothetical protein
METETVAMLEAAGVSPAWIYACQHTDGLLPRPDGSFTSARDQAEWDEAVSRYIRVHQPGTVVSHQAETRKLAAIVTIMTLQMAADDPGYGAAMAGHLGTASDPADPGSALLREYLRARAGELGGALRADRAVARAAAECARTRGGASLAARLQQAARARAGGVIADDVLLAAAVAMIRSPGSPGSMARKAGGGPRYGLRQRMSGGELEIRVSFASGDPGSWRGPASGRGVRDGCRRRLPTCRPRPGTGR